MLGLFLPLGADVHLLLPGLLGDVELGADHKLDLFLISLPSSKLDLPDKVSFSSDLDASFSLLSEFVYISNDSQDMIVVEQPTFTVHSA